MNKIIYFLYHFYTAIAVDILFLLKKYFSVRKFFNFYIRSYFNNINISIRIPKTICTPILYISNYYSKSLKYISISYFWIIQQNWDSKHKYIANIQIYRNFKQFTKIETFLCHLAVFQGLLRYSIFICNLDILIAGSS